MTQRREKCKEGKALNVSQSRDSRMNVSRSLECLSVLEYLECLERKGWTRIDDPLAAFVIISILDSSFHFYHGIEKFERSRI